MMCKGKRSKGLCPVSLGLALALVMGLAVLILPQFTHLAMPTVVDYQAAGIAFVKGFFAGFFLAIFYDLISCCCPCCRGGCGCGCKCCDGGTCACCREEKPVSGETK